MKKPGYILLLIIFFANTIKAQDLNQQIIESAKKNDLSQISILIKKGANINAQDQNKANVFMWAVYKSNLKAVKYLYEQGADININGIIYLDAEKTGYYGNLLGIAAGEGKLSILKYLTEVCKINIEDKEYVVETDKKEGWTALQWASFAGQKKVVEYLISRGANLNANHTEDKNTPLHYAIQNGRNEIGKILISAGADVNLPMSNGWTGLHLLSQTDNVEFIKLLLKNKASTNIKTEEGYTPLILAAYNKQYKVCKLLIDYGADINMPDNKGYVAKDYTQNLNIIGLLEDPQNHVFKKQNISLNDQITFAIQLYQTGDYKKASVKLEKVLTDTRNTYGEKDTVMYSKILIYTALSFDQISKKEKAITYYSQAVAVYKSYAITANDIWYEMSLDNLSTIYDNINEYKKAETFYIDLLDYRKETFGEKHEKYASTINDLAVLYSNLFEYEKSETYFEEAINIRKEILGDKHPDYAASINSLAILYYEQGNYAKAEALYIEAVEIYKNVYGNKHELYSNSLNNLAVLYTQTGNFKKAESYYMEVIEIDKEIFGEKHKDYAVDLINLAALYQEMGDYNKAEELLLKAINIEKETLGKNHSDYATTLDNLASLYSDINNYKKAEKLYLEAMNIRKTVFGTQHPHYATSLNNLGLIYYYTFNYEKAKKLYLEAINIRKAVLGSNNIDYATSIEAYAVLLSASGNYEEAEKLYTQALNIRKTILGENNPLYAVSLYNVAEFYENKGNYKKAEKLYLESLNISEKIYGKKHKKYAYTLNLLANLYKTMGDFPKAKPLCLEVVKIYEENYDEQEPDYGTSLNSLADYYYLTGDYKKAEALFLEAKEITKKNYGKNHPNYASVLNNIAELYRITGKYEKAEPLYLEAIKISKEIFGEQHPEYAISVQNLAILYHRTGNYKKAEALHIEAMNIRKNVFGEKHLDYANSLNNLGLLYSDLGNYDKSIDYYMEVFNIRKEILEPNHLQNANIINNIALIQYEFGFYSEAEQLFLTSTNIYKKVLGKNNRYYALSLNNLGLLYLDIDNYDKSEKYFIEALTVYQSVFGKENPDYANALNSTALLYLKIGNSAKTKEKAIEAYQKAEKYFIEALEKRKKTLGNKHPDYASSLNNLALLYRAKRDYLKAEKLITEANQIINLQIRQSIEFMSEKEREQFIDYHISSDFDVFHSFYLTKRKENKKLPGIVYNNALTIKGQLLKSAIAIRKSILQSGDTTLIQVYTEMNKYAKILTQEYAMPVLNRRPDIEELEEKVNTLEKELALNTKSSANLRWKNIRKSLKKHEIAIEFIHFDYQNNKKWTDSTLYYALILRKNYKNPKAIFLFEQKQLQKVMHRSYDTDEYNYIKKLYDPKSTKAQSLYKLVWKPLEQYLQNTENIFISPSGILNKISYDAIPYDTINILSDKYKIIYTTSTAQAVNRTSLFEDDIKNSVLFGGIKYDIKPEEMENISLHFRGLTKNTSQITETNLSNFQNLQEKRGIDSLTRNITWNYLPGTLQETEEIKTVLKRKNIKVKLYNYKQGTEEQFKALEKNAPSILHVSTHGFYFGDDEKSQENKDMIDKKVKFAYSENPLLRSGFILAGGNAAFQGKKIPDGVEDGVLTAAEISRLTFFNTKLVVLSACQTGLGDIVGNEGVYGLQRSFKMAGVDYLLFSLWEVPDDTTKELMSNFYENWFTGMEIREAFKKAQNQLKTKYAKVEGAAFAWAAFVLMK